MKQLIEDIAKALVDLPDQVVVSEVQGEQVTVLELRVAPTGRRKKRSRAMPKTSRTRISADEIAEKASRGEDVSAYFTNKFTVVRPVPRVNVDLTPGMLRQLDARAARLNISRQAVIKTLLSRALEGDSPGKRRPNRKAG